MSRLVFARLFYLRTWHLTIGTYRRAGIGVIGLAVSMLVCANVAFAGGGVALPAVLGKLQVNAPVSSTRVTPDGKLLAVQLVALPGGTPQILLVNAADPARPFVIGNIAIEANGSWELSPDGRRLLVLTQSGASGPGKVRDFQLTAIGLADPAQPRRLWQRSFHALSFALAPDASAYVYTQVAKSRPDHWEATITWVDGRPSQVIGELNAYEAGSEALRLSNEGSYLLLGKYGGLKVNDLRGTGLIRLEQSRTATTGWSRLISIQPGGSLLMDDERLGRFRVYAIKPGMPLLASAPFVGRRDIFQLRLISQSGDSILLADPFGRYIQVDVMADRVLIARNFALPYGNLASSMDASGHLFVSRMDGGRNEIVIHDFSRTEAFFVDWPALKRAWTEALSIQTDPRRAAYQRDWDALERLNKASVQLALDAPVSGISNKTAASILHDYGRLMLQHQGPGSAIAQTAFSRALALDPQRSSTHLALAELLRASLPGITDWRQKQAATSQAATHYRHYLQLGGVRSAAIKLFLRDPSEMLAAGDICGAVAKYANAGRLGELVSDTATDIPFGNERIDLAFVLEGTAHVPALYASRTDGSDIAGEIASPAGSDRFWGGDKLGLLVYRGVAHVLHFHDMRHPVASTSLSGDVRCEFQNRTVEKVSASAPEPGLCAQLHSGKGPRTLAFDGPVSMGQEEVRKKYSETGITARRRIDVLNNGNPMTVAQFDLSSGAGAGCEETFFDQVDEQGSRFESGPRRDLLIAMQGISDANRFPVLPCGNNPRFFRYRGQTFFETRPAQWPPIDDWEQYHRVLRIRGGKVEDVCGFAFSTSVHLRSARDRQDGGAK